MTDIKKRVAFLWILSMAVGATAAAQSSHLDNGSAPLARGGSLAFYWDTRLEPPEPALGGDFGSAFAVTLPGVVHRVLLDGARKTYFGYDVRVEALPERHTFRLAFGPLSLTPALREQLLGSDSSGWSRMETPAFATPVTIMAGQVLELPLLTGDAWGQRVVEYVTVQEPDLPQGFDAIGSPRREFVFAPGAPRDFAVDDVELRLQAPRVSVNGIIDESSLRIQADLSGSVVWVYVPGRGRYLLSLVPRPKQAYRKAGDVRGNSLRFVVGRDTIALSAGARIAPGEAAFNLYVLHEPAWRPTYAHANLEAVMFGAIDRVEYRVGVRF
jgi:hypothetical protein